jgi:hypothetical protein
LRRFVNTFLIVLRRTTECRLNDIGERFGIAARIWSVLKCADHHTSGSWVAVLPAITAGGNDPAPKQQGNAVTDLSNELRELPIDEMTGEELDIVTGGTPSFTSIGLAAIAAIKAYDAKFGLPLRDIATELH